MGKEHWWFFIATTFSPHLASTEDGWLLEGASAARDKESIGSRTRQKMMKMWLYRQDFAKFPSIEST
ncbi:hypothetical protein TNCV_3033751 [Trichonephila clavipes]|nr:hypothetical protein TNCV_3033751 [Trichonephila clavipes]